MRLRHAQSLTLNGRLVGLSRIKCTTSGRVTGYSFALVAAPLSKQRRWGRADLEMLTAYRLDLHDGLERLDTDNRARLEARFLHGLPLYRIGQQRGRLCSKEVQVLLDQAIEQLAEAMNKGGNGTMRGKSDEATLPAVPPSGRRNRSRYTTYWSTSCWSCCRSRGDQ